MRKTQTPWMRAVFEFVVIVVGVLVALAVDEWRTDRAERASEAEYIGRLLVDVRRDSTLLADVFVPGVVSAQVALARIAPIARREAPFPADTVAALLDVLSGTGGIAQLGRRTTFEELESTGQVRLIRSPSLRSAILDYYAAKDVAQNRAQVRESGLATIVRSYLPELPTGISFNLDTRGTTPETLREFGVKRGARVFAAAGLEEAMMRHQNYPQLVRPMLESVLADATGLIALLERELNRRSH